MWRRSVMRSVSSPDSHAACWLAGLNSMSEDARFSSASKTAAGVEREPCEVWTGVVEEAVDTTEAAGCELECGGVRGMDCVREGTDAEVVEDTPVPPFI